MKVPPLGQVSQDWTSSLVTLSLASSLTHAAIYRKKQPEGPHQMLPKWGLPASSLVSQTKFFPWPSSQAQVLLLQQHKIEQDLVPASASSEASSLQVTYDANIQAQRGAAIQHSPEQGEAKHSASTDNTTNDPR